MKTEKVVIDGKEYKYFITKNNTVNVEGIVSFRTYSKIVDLLIKEGKYTLKERK